ncbi:hypothetical protein M595_0535 [Lyngbya aestuarii BL J]|uniref:Uncharacterized protein n=1 Tax=Lyngbya aestuarii BL J TaxID=1348334 RepID=U7QNP6_9CYAN|nr:hypothetical protein M595_0535 [Lyngbya aestuarii BL J]
MNKHGFECIGGFRLVPKTVKTSQLKELRGQVLTRLKTSF